MTEIDVAPRSGEELLRLTVVSRGLRLGHVTDLIVDLDGGRAVGFEVMCGDGAERFLPIAAADVTPRAIEVASALMLLDRQGASFYLERATPLSALRSVELAAAGRPLGKLVDVYVRADGSLESVLVSANGGAPSRVVPHDVRPAVQTAPAA